MNPAIGYIMSGKDIVGYWKKASKDHTRNDGIDVTWDGQAYEEKTPHVGAYMLYRHDFPPKSEFSDSHVRVTAENKLDDVLFYSNGTRHPNGDYSHLTEYKIYVKENPDNTSSSRLSNKGIVPVKASEYLSSQKIRQHDFGPEETIYIDKDPEISVVREA